MAERTPLYGWYKVVWDASASSLSFYYSTDGFFWVFLATRTGQTQPTRIGLGFENNSGSLFADHQLVCDFFRVTEP